MTSNLGIYILMALGVLAVLDIVAIYKSSASSHDNKYFVGWLIVLAILVTCVVIGMTGCGPRKVVIYPVKGCEYWPNKYHYGTTFYREGAPTVMLQPYVKQCYPDKKKAQQ